MPTGNNCRRSICVLRPLITSKRHKSHLLSQNPPEHNPGGGGYCLIWAIWAIWVCAPTKGVVFKQFTLR